MTYTEFFDSYNIKNLSTALPKLNTKRSEEMLSIFPHRFDAFSSKSSLREYFLPKKATIKT